MVPFTTKMMSSFFWQQSVSYTKLSLGVVWSHPMTFSAIQAAMRCLKALPGGHGFIQNAQPLIPREQSYGWPRSQPSSFWSLAVCKNSKRSKTGAGEGLGTRLVMASPPTTLARMTRKWKPVNLPHVCWTAVSRLHTERFMCIWYLVFLYYSWRHQSELCEGCYSWI